MCSGREFQMWAAATGKARLPTVARLTAGTTRRLVPAERSALRPGTSTVEVSGPGPGPSAPESSTLTTRLASHPGFYYTWDEMTFTESTALYDRHIVGITWHNVSN